MINIIEYVMNKTDIKSKKYDLKPVIDLYASTHRLEINFFSSMEFNEN